MSFLLYNDNKEAPINDENKNINTSLLRRTMESGNIGEHMKEGNIKIGTTLEKDAYLDALCSKYQKCRENITPSEFYNDKIEKYPKVGEIVSEKEFLIKLFDE